MNITGLEELTFGVDNVSACVKYLTDYGLTPVGVDASGGRFEAQDGTAIVVRHKNDAALPSAGESMSERNTLRRTTHTVDTQSTLDAIATELSKDRAVSTLPDGTIQSVDDLGFVIAFKVGKRRPITTKAEGVNSPGSPLQRPANVLGTHDGAPAMPLTLSHVVYYVPDAQKAMAFYVDRLGFRCTDILGASLFVRPAGTQEHHTMFFIQTPPFMKGINHFTFHMNGPTAVMQAGYRFVAKGYESFWGPGRHKMGSNWFWYFQSPFGCQVEYDADMDTHDDNWVPTPKPMSSDESQVFLFNHREMWSPEGSSKPVLHSAAK